MLKSIITISSKYKFNMKASNPLQADLSGKHYLIWRDSRWVGTYTERDLRHFWAVGTLNEGDFLREEGVVDCFCAGELLKTAPLAQGPKAHAPQAGVGGYEVQEAGETPTLVWIHYGLTTVLAAGGIVFFVLSPGKGAAACLLAAAFLLIAGAARRLMRIGHSLALAAAIAALLAWAFYLQDQRPAQRVENSGVKPRLTEQTLIQPPPSS
jgi:hypothetical protein